MRGGGGSSVRRFVGRPPSGEASSEPFFFLPRPGEGPVNQPQPGGESCVSEPTPRRPPAVPTDR